MNSDFIKLIKIILWQWKVALLIFVLFCSASLIYSVNLKKIYRATAIVAVVEDGSGGGLDSIMSRYGALANFAGVKVDQQTSKSGLAIETIKSRSFFKNETERYPIIRDLLAVVDWDSKNNELIYDANVYDEKASKWIEYSGIFRKQQKPTYLDAFVEYEKRLSIVKLEEAGIIRISFEHYSPHVANRIVNNIIKDVNEILRSDAIDESNNLLNHLEESVKTTSLSELKMVYYELISSQLQQKMLANVKEEYVFKIVDPSVVENRAYKPSRLLVFIMLLILSGILTVVICIVRYLIHQRDS